MRADGDPLSSDAPVGEVRLQRPGADAFAEQFDRDSIDGEGGALSVTVHHGDRYDNAFWDGSQLVFGDAQKVVQIVLDFGDAPSS